MRQIRRSQTQRLAGRGRAGMLTAIVLFLALPAVAGANGSTDAAASSAWPRCEHPWPCADGSEWPAELEGPFEVSRMERIRIPVGDGQELDGVVVHPSLPEGVRAPVILEATPYAGNTWVPPDSPRWSLPGSDPLAYWDMRQYVEAGYAYAIVNVLGTGGSDGCFDAWGPGDQVSLATAVEWLAARPWSNGRVGMTGYSAAGGTPFVAALADPPSLKTIVPAAIISNLYTLLNASPQGAVREVTGSVPPDWASYAAAVTWMPPATSSPEHAGPGWAQRFPGRLCPAVQDFALDRYRSVVSDERAAAFYEPRMLTKRLPSIRASVFIAHGLLDSGHGWQEDDVWDALSGAPKRMVLGQWGHGFPPQENLATSGLGDTWHEVTLPWFDFWLKGVGEPPRVGVVDHQDDVGSWHASTAWPPAEAEGEALFLVGGSLQTQPGEGDARFVSTPIGADHVQPAGCTPDPGTGPAVIFISEPASTEALLAGNPVLRLKISSDQPGGVFSVALYAWRGDQSPCTQDFLLKLWGFLDPSGLRFLSAGDVDLRYHAGDLRGTDFPAGPQVVRADLWNVSHRIAEGERLLLVLGRANVGSPGWTSRHSVATITLHAGGTDASQLVLPLVEGTLHGAQPAIDVPPRPFQPGS